MASNTSNSHRRPSVFSWVRLPERDKRRLLHLISQWFVEEGLSHAGIAKKIKDWIINEKIALSSESEVTTQFVGRRIAEAAQEYGFLRVSPFYEEELAQKIAEGLFLKESVKLFVAPNREELLRYVWLDLDPILTNRMKDNDEAGPIIGVSGGQTMIDLARVARSLPELMWHEQIPVDRRKKVTICSLTSGGIRSDIAALSDIVAASIAEYLGAEARGLLGPAWFADKSSLAAFRNDREIQEHLQLVDKAEVILTSVGYLGDQKALLRQLLEQAKGSKFVEERPNLSDILYNCYDGFSGEPIELPETIRDHLFSVIDLKKLHDKVQGGSQCFVLAVGKQKGCHSVIGILKKQMANRVYMDKDCAEGVLEALR